MRRWTGSFIVVVLVCSGLLTSILGVGAAPPANEHFQRTWARTDQPVATGRVSRTWMWGPEGFTGQLWEPYAESPGGQRVVQYFDKSRMEITNPAGDAGSIWYVTNGLLVVELITGQMQTGNASFSQRQPAQVNVAGDADDPTGPTYATFGGLLNAPPAAVGTLLTNRLSRDGQVTNDPSLAAQGLTVAVIDEVTNHAIAGPFWEFMNSSGVVWDGSSYVTAPLFENAYFATGRPITEAYWASVKVAGTYQDVLMQCFERRCLTYNPANAPEWRVEAGNVGQHYYAWRYGQSGGGPSPSPEPSPTEPKQPATQYAYAFAFGSSVRSTLPLLPHGMDMDVDGTIYAADSDRDRVIALSGDGEFLRSLDPVGPNGTPDGRLNDPADVAIYWPEFSSAAEVLVADHSNDRLAIFYEDRYNTSIGTSGPQKMKSPTCVVVHNDIIYVCDRNNVRVSLFNAKSREYIDSLKASITNPTDIAVDPAGKIYVADSFHYVVVYSPSLTFEGYLKLPDDQLPFNYYGVQRSLAIAPDGTVWVMDWPFTGNDAQPLTRIARFDSNGNFLGVWGTSDTLPGLVNRGRSIMIDADGYIYVGGWDELPDGSKREGLTKFNPNGEVVWSIIDDNRGHFDLPVDVAVASDGKLLITDATDKISRIHFWQPDGKPAPLDGVRFNAKPGQATPAAPSGIAAGPNGHFYVADSAQNVVSEFNANWELVRTWDAATSALGAFKNPRGVATDATGNVYVVDSGNAAVRKFTADGTVLGSWGHTGDGPGRLKNPIDIVIVGERVYVTDQELHQVVVFDLNGTHITSWGGLGETAGQFNTPRGIAADADGHIYVVDSGNARVQKFTPEGEWLATFGGGGAMPLSQPQGVAVTADGKVYVVDQNNDRVVVYEPRG